MQQPLFGNRQRESAVFSQSLVTRAAMLGALLSLMAMTLTAGCAADKTGEPAATCVPSRAVYDAAADAMLQTHCRSCHGATPTFGAPTTFGDYDALVAGKEGERAVDRMISRLVDGSMPSVGTPKPPHGVVDTLTEWASCGDAHPDHSVGLTSSAQVFRAPDAVAPDLPSFELRSPGFAVAPDTLDLYQCFTYAVPLDAERFVRRIEVIVDDARVVHHVVLLKDPKKDFKVGEKACKGMPPDSQYLYAWAPGAGAVEFPEGGMRVLPGEHYVVQVHYNNGAGAADVKDTSGVRIWHGPTEGTEYGMFAPGPLIFSIPPGTAYSTTGTCKIKEKTTLLAGMPHMHENGVAFSQQVVRKDGTVEPLIEITGWSFELQPFYLTPVVLEAGDRLMTTCTWQHDFAKEVPFGSGTADEMCFNFVFATPPPKDAYCDDFEIDANAAVAYTPGQCAGPSPLASPPRVTSAVRFDAAPSPSGGANEDGHWELKQAAIYLPALAKNYVADGSFTAARGQAWTAADGTLTLDLSARIVVGLTGGTGIDGAEAMSRRGKLVPTANGKSTELSPDCGAENALALKVGIEGDELIVAGSRKVSGFDVPLVYRFARVEAKP